jgi:hypothetical protein
MFTTVVGETPPREFAVNKVDVVGHAPVKLAKLTSFK